MRFLAYILSVFTALTLSAAIVPDDSVKVSFRVGHRQFDPSLGDNREAMDNFIKAVKEADADDNIERIVIRAYASPDGSHRANELLAERRCDVIANLIVNRTGISRDLVERQPQGIAWDEVRQLVAETPDVPSREAVLDILDNVPVKVTDSRGALVDGRKHRLMALDGGEPYRWMYRNLFPRVRSAVAVALIKKHPDATPVEEVVVVEVPEPEPECETVETVEPEPEVAEPMPELPAAQRLMVDNRVALKTNLLGYPVLMPNIEVEWKFVDRWSAALEWQGAWYSKTPPHKVYRLSTVIPEVRYWPLERSRWHGMYVGAFGGWGLYDLSKGKKGHEGEGFMGGVSLGYMWPISKHLSLDAGIGVGYMHARDKLYKPLDGHYLYQLTKNINYVGPLRLKLSLVWRLQSEQKQSVK